MGSYRGRERARSSRPSAQGAGAMSAFFKKRSASIYYFLALLIACAVVAHGISVMVVDADAAAAFGWLGGDIKNAGGYINIPWIFHFAMKSPTLFGIFVFAAAPAIAALVAATLAGRLPRLLSMLAPWRGPGGARRALAVYAIILSVYAAGLGLFSWITWRHGGPEALLEAWAPLGGIGLMGAVGALAALFLDEGGTLEELGWRGFLQDVLSEKMAPLAVALAIGALWWAWHLPREALTILSGAPISEFLWSQTIFLLLCLGLSIVIAVAWNRVGGSIWVGVLIHGGTNVWSKALGSAPFESFSGALKQIHPLLGFFDLRTVIVLVMAGLLLALFGPRLGFTAPAVNA